jgi:tRNA (guanine-N7-)-methyltransferase
MGRPLSAHQALLLDTLLPRVAVPEGPLDPRALFPQAREFAFEVGFGGGEHVAAQARVHPDWGFIACEPFVNGVGKLLAEIEASDLSNIRVHMGDARDVLARLPQGILTRVFVLFPDPWPKMRHHKRRFVQRETLDQLARVLKAGGEFRLATDHADYAVWALQHLMAERRFRWTAERSSDWRARTADWPATRYEQKALKAGRACTYLRFLRV